MTASPSSVTEWTNSELAKMLGEARLKIQGLEAEVKRLSQPEWYNDWEDAEYSYGDLSDAADNISGSEVMRLMGSRQVCEVWVTHRALTLDDEGDADEIEVAEFDNEAGAVACWDASVAELRAAEALRNREPT